MAPCHQTDGLLHWLLYINLIEHFDIKGIPSWLYQSAGLSFC